MCVLRSPYFLHFEGFKSVQRHVVQFPFNCLSLIESMACVKLGSERAKLWFSTSPARVLRSSPALVSARLTPSVITAVINAVFRRRINTRRSHRLKEEAGKQRRGKRNMRACAGTRLPRNTQMDLHVHLGVTVSDSLPRNHLPRKITGEDNISVIPLLHSLFAYLLF